MSSSAAAGGGSGAAGGVVGGSAYAGVSISDAASVLEQTRRIGDQMRNDFTILKEAHLHVRSSRSLSPHLLVVRRSHSLLCCCAVLCSAAPLRCVQLKAEFQRQSEALRTALHDAETARRSKDELDKELHSLYAQWDADIKQQSAHFAALQSTMVPTRSVQHRSALRHCSALLAYAPAHLPVHLSVSSHRLLYCVLCALPLPPAFSESWS
jgi:hypothetical protein